VAEEVDRCVTCGYCEPVCPSRHLTLTPRQRIVTLRAIEQARLDGDGALVAELERDWEYSSVETCAVDGLCQTACPVNINTAVLVKRFRRRNAGPVINGAWGAAAKNWGTVTRGAGHALTAIRKVPIGVVLGPDKLARTVLGKDTVPLYSAELPGGGSARKRPSPGLGASPDAVYFPACVGAMFGPAVESAPGIQKSFELLCERAGITLLVPEGIDKLCCGTPWSSKGLVGGLATMQRKTLAGLRVATRDGLLPIVCDASSCTEGLRHTIESDTSEPKMTVIDSVEFAVRHILPTLTDHAQLESLALHPTCSSRRLGLDASLEKVAGEIAATVLTPENAGCCAFAGDRGMLHPELTASATKAEAADVAAMGATAHASCNRTCELGMTRATGEPYRHILELLEEVTRPGPVEDEALLTVTGDLTAMPLG
jgi:D-lactate dehydrogenase